MPPFAAFHHLEPAPVDALHRDLVVPAVAGGLRHHAKFARGGIGTIDRNSLPRPMLVHLLL